MVAKNEEEVRRALQNMRAERQGETSQFLQQLRSMREGGELPPPNESPGLMRNLGATLISPLAAPFSAEARARVRATGSGIVDTALARPIQALLEVPGLFSQQEMMSDRAAQFVQRLREGIYTVAEERALAAGLTEKEIADSYAIGGFIGYTAPVVASVKVASLILRSPVETSKIFTMSNLINDLTAGALFGAVLEPATDIDDRIKHLLRESALFGVGRIMIAGIALPWQGYRNRRTLQQMRLDDVKEMVERVNQGLPVTIDTKDKAIGLAKLLSEEDMVASSAAAQELVKSFGDERALLQAVVEVAESGSSAGIVRNIGRSFKDADELVTKFRSQFPALKFSTPIRVAGDEGYAVHFGMTGLSNLQKNQLKNTGRFTGQIVEKNGTQYEIVNPVPDAKGKLQVRTSDGKNTRIEQSQVSDTSHGVEMFGDTTIMDDLYQKFQSDFFSGWRKVSQAVQGELPEEELIRAIREGRLHLPEDARRAFDVAGAITYPEELGLIGTPMEEVLSTIASRGTRGARVLTEGGSVTNFEDVVEAWARNADLPADAPDFLAMKAHFAQRLREHMWKQVPEADRKVFENIRDRFLALADSGEIPFSAIAHNKGFNVETLEAGRMSLRDIRTGQAFEFGSEERARDFLLHVIRSDKNMLGDPFNMGSGGMSAIMKGFNLTDGTFTMDGTMPRAKRFVDDIPATSGMQNVRDILVRIEHSIGVPVFTQVFDSLDKLVSRQRQQVEPWAFRIDEVWRKLSVKDAIQVGKKWSEVDGSNLSMAQAVRAFKLDGMSDAQISAFVESRKIYDALFKLTGIDNRRFVNLYYSRVQPYAEKTGGQVDLERIFGKGRIPPEFQFFAEMTRTGELSMRELNPATVMHQYVRSLFFKREVASAYEKARLLTKKETTPKAGDLSPAQRVAIEGQLRRRLRDDEPIIAEPIQKLLREYLNVVRGMPTSTQQTFRDFAKRFFKEMGVSVEEKAIDEMANIGLSAMYGAAMAFRPALVARNMVQSWWTLYPRIGSKHYSEALKKALTTEGFQEAMESGAIRASEAGIPFADQAFRSLMDRIPVDGTGPMSRALAASIRSGMRVGNVSRDIARKGLLPYSSADDIERAIVYNWHKLHTAEVLAKYESRAISWDKFMEDGLPFFHDVIKQRFSQIYNRLGREDALRWIGKQAADEADFIYGAGAQPGWLQSAPGRFMGMFATWPMWAIELYGRRSWNGTPGQIAAFHARTLALVGAFSNLTIQSGVALWNWIAPISIFSYGGGPVADYMVQTKRLIDAELDQKGDALTTLAKQVGRLSLPGQVAYTDVRDALDMANPAQAAYRIMLGRPMDEGNFMTDVVYSSENTGMKFQHPESERALDELRGLRIPRVPLEDL